MAVLKQKKQKMPTVPGEKLNRGMPSCEDIRFALMKLHFSWAIPNPKCFQHNYTVKTTKVIRLGVRVRNRWHISAKLYRLSCAGHTTWEAFTGTRHETTGQ